MSQLLHIMNELLAGKDPTETPDPIVPGYEPSVPDPLKSSTSTILGWAAGLGIAAAVLGSLVGWLCVAVGHNTERGALAARGKQGILWSLVSGGGIGVTSSLVLAFYNLTN
ncbi:hypothetical protein ACFV2X_42875 [Streptomyces sp. NPDC059679]|uniref:hypothetical protein n=1 Tax=Streptomyces sp. NPDC059679 TaxID=3346903 RepID=UPI0036C192AA